MAKDIPKRVFVIVAPCALLAWVLTIEIAGYLWAKVCPFLVYGVEAYRQNIKVSGGDWRHTLEFSNGVTIHGVKLLPLIGVWAVLYFALFLGLLFVLLRFVAWFVRMFDSTLASDVAHFFSRF